MARQRNEPVEQEYQPPEGMSWPHPQASIAGGASGLGVVVATLLATLHVVNSPEVATVISGAIVTAIFFLGREGLVGLWQQVKYGASHIKYGSAPPPEPPAPIQSRPRKKPVAKKPPKTDA